MRKLAIIAAIVALGGPVSAQSFGAAGVVGAIGAFGASGSFSAESNAAGTSSAGVGTGFTSSRSSSGAAQIAGSSITIGFGTDVSDSTFTSTEEVNTSGGGTTFNSTETINANGNDWSGSFVMVGDTFTNGEDFSTARGNAFANANRDGSATSDGGWGLLGAGAIGAGFSTN